MSSALSLDRRLQNSRFESWKIGSNFVDSRLCIELPGQVFEGAGDAVDFLHTRAAVLRNHLLESHGRLFIVTRNKDKNVWLNEVASTAAGEALQLIMLADIPLSPAGTLAAAPVEAALHCSVAVVAPPAAATGPGASAVAAAGMLLVSAGQGDLTLLQAAPTGKALLSNVVFPLRPAPPLPGVRPFVIEAAYITPSGYIRCVMTALATISENNRSSQPQQPRGVCETWLITLQHTPPPTAAAAGSKNGLDLSVSVVGSQLLMVSRSPPAAAVATCVAAASAAAAIEGLLLVGEPPLEDDELPAGYAPATAAAAVPPQHSGAAASPDADQPTHGGAAAADGGCGGGGNLLVAADMDIDPRTLQQAAARLAQFTSEEASGELPQQQWTDVFKESGPTEFSDAEVEVDVMLFSSTPQTPSATAQETASALAAAPGGTPHASSAAASIDSSNSLPVQLQLTSSVSCGPHRLLAAQLMTPSSSSSSSRQPHPAGLLLGLTDDVDCSVVAAQLTAAQPAAAAAGSSSSVPGCGVLLSHEANLPALAYVAAGKTQRRHLLLGFSGSPVCGVLVEWRQYAYLYGQVAAQQAYGQQQILDMQLPPGSSILGARLVQDSSSRAGCNAACGAASASGRARLLLLTSSQLICYEIRAPL